MIVEERILRNIEDEFQKLEYCSGIMTQDNYGCYDIEYKLPKDWDYNDGISKVVLIPAGADYVIKVPFDGYYDEEAGEWYNEESEEWEWDEDAICDVEFEGAYYAPYHNDYCYQEMIIGEHAKAAGLEDIFPPTEYVSTIQGYKIYIQQRAETFYRGLYPPLTEKEKTSTRDRLKSKNQRVFNLKWQKEALDWYGEEKFDAFMEFLNDEGIYDLHDGNLGYIDGRPIILDYADYNS